MPIRANNCRHRCKAPLTLYGVRRGASGYRLRATQAQIWTSCNHSDGRTQCDTPSQDWGQIPSGACSGHHTINAWRVARDWERLIHPDDFPPDRRTRVTHCCRAVCRTARMTTPRPTTLMVGVSMQAATMAKFTASYWAVGGTGPAFLPGDGLRHGLSRGGQYAFSKWHHGHCRSVCALNDLDNRTKSARIPVVGRAAGLRCGGIVRRPKQACTFPAHNS